MKHFGVEFVKDTPLRVVFSTLFSVFHLGDETLHLMLGILLGTRSQQSGIWPDEGMKRKTSLQ